MDQITLSKMTNERQNFENATSIIQKDLKELDNGGSITKNLFIEDLEEVITAAQELKTKLSLDTAKSE